MSESIINGILEEIYGKEFEELDKLPEVKTSFRHKLAMKKIFSDFEKNTRKNADFHCNKHISTKRRMLLIIAIIICAVMLQTGQAVMYFSPSFSGTVYRDNTHLYAVNTDNCPQFIEKEYILSRLPHEFEEVDYDSSPFSISHIYENKSTGQNILFTQCVKSVFNCHYNTENHQFEEIDINGHAALCIEFSNSSVIAWDNGDYILQIGADLSKSDVLDLAKSAKVE